MPRTILLMRHAKSSWKHPELSDHDRPLKKRGRRDATRVGAALHEAGLTPDHIVSSTAVRARATAELVAEYCGYPGPIICTAEMYLAGPEEIADVIAASRPSARIVLAVGHNPGLESTLAALAGADEVLPTAAVARVEIDAEAWSDLRLDGRGRLVELWRARELG